MSATDELRRLLDEHGAKHSDYDGITEWCGRLGAVCRGFQRHSDDHLDVMVVKTDPGSAVDATLERGKCKWELVYSGPLYDKWQCSECRFLFVEPRRDPRCTEMEPNFCPNCGRRVEA